MELFIQKVKAIVDNRTIKVSAGKGGDGMISLLRISHNPTAGLILISCVNRKHLNDLNFITGPDGGDGGNGGHIIFKV